MRILNSFGRIFGCSKRYKIKKKAAVIIKKTVFVLFFMKKGLLLIISLLFVLDLFVNRGQSATFDGPTHLTNIAMFFKSMKSGEWHVTWTDGFANYGMPIGLIAQQTTSYLGALVNFFSNNIVFSYNVVAFIGVFLSTVFFYWFLRLYFKPMGAFVGAVFFHLAPYRIINLYIRGALPEFFASVFLPLLLIGIYFLFNKKQLPGFLLVVISVAFLILTHPMMLIIYAFIFVPYFFYNLFEKKQMFVSIFLFSVAFFLGIGLTGYYSIPLLREVKYFYYGLSNNHFAQNQFMTLANFFDPRWFYFYKGDILTRGHFIQSGMIETIILLIGTGVVLYAFLTKKKKEISLMALFVLIAFILVFLMSKFAVPLYGKNNILSNIQHQWRLFSAFIFIPPIILAHIVDRLNSRMLMYGLIVLICVLRFPQLYGKNYTVYPESRYYFNPENLHGNIMNTIWTGPTQDYPIKTEKPEIIEGKGVIASRFVQNSLRKYKVNAETDIRIADYTFFFPGWRAYVDGKETEIQFQDPAYRGIITYNVPKGEHNIIVKFTDTKIRFVGKIISIISLAVLLVVIMISRKSHAKT